MDTLFEKKLVTTKEAGEISGYHSDYLARLARSGKISGKRIGHTWLIDQESLVRFVEEQDHHKIDYARALARAREEEYVRYQNGAQGAVRLGAGSVPQSGPAKGGNKRLILTKRFPGVKSGKAKTIGHTPNVSLMSEINIGKASFLSHAFALSLSFAVIISAALVARADFVPHLAQSAGETIRQVAYGFTETFGDIPSDFASHLNLASERMLAHGRVAPRYPLVPIELFAIRPLKFTFTYESDVPQSQHKKIVPAAGTSMHGGTVTAGDVYAALRGAYALVSSPKDIPAALASAHASLGYRAYDAIEKSFAAYDSLVRNSGAYALELGIATRDALAQSPRLVNDFNIGLGNAVVGAARYALGAHETATYAIVDAAPESARAVVAFIGGAGDVLARTTSGVPPALAELYLDATAVPVYAAPRLASAAFSLEYALASRFLSAADAVTLAYLAAVEDAGTLAHEGIALARTALPSAEPLFAYIAKLPFALEDAYLSAIGKVALAIDVGLTKSNMSIASFAGMPQIAAIIAAVEPTLNFGERAALATYTTLNNLFNSATNALAYLIGPPPTVVLPSIPERPVVAVATTTPAVPKPTVQPTTVYSSPTYTTVVRGVSENFVNQSLASLRAELLTTVSGLLRPVQTQQVTNIQTIQQVNRIEDLSNLIVRNGDFRGGKLIDATNVTGTNATFTTLTTTNFTAGDSSLSTTNITGNLTTTGAITSYTSATAPYFAATSTAATSTFEGGLAVGTSKFVVDSTTGNVGIGTTSPSSLLSVQGSGYFSGTGFFGGAVTATSTLSVTGLTTLGNASTTQLGSTGSAYLATAGGSLGIGTTTPWAQLSINPNGITGPAFVVGSSTATNLIVTNGGYVGVGTTSPSSALAVSGDFFLTGSTTITGPGSGIVFTGTGNHDITASGGTLRIGSNTIIGNIQALDDTVDIGTPVTRFDKIYANEVNATTLVGTLSGGNLAAETFTINSDNATADTESSYLVFERGSVTPSASLSWNAGATAKRFEFNQPLFIQNADASTTLATFDLKSVAGQTADIFRIASSSGDYLLNFTAGGKLGIGTTSPYAMINTSAVKVLDITAAGTGGLVLHNGSGSEFSIMGSGSGNYIDAAGNSTASNNFISFRTQPSASAYGSGITEAMRITSAGLVGIGTTSPFGTLSVTNQSNNGAPALLLAGTAADNRINLDNQGTGGRNYRIESSSGASGHGQGKFVIADDTASGAARFVIDSSGNIGIGTTTPGTGLTMTGGLEINGTGSTQFELSRSGNPGLAINISESATGDANFYDRAGGSWTRSLTLRSGNVGIGTTTPETKLNIEATALSAFTGTSDGAFRIQADTGANQYTAFDFASRGSVTGGAAHGNPLARIASQVTSSGSYLHFGTSNLFASGITNTAMTIDYSGNVGIGTTSPTAQLEIKAAGTNVGLLVRGSNGANALQQWFGATGGKVATLNDNGAFGIAGSRLYFDDATASTGTTYIQESGGLQIVSGASRDIILSAGSGGERIRIKNDTGNVGIGTTTPTNLLVVSKDQNAATFVDITNFTNNTAAEAGLRLLNSAGTVAQFGLYAPSHNATGALAAGDAFAYTTASAFDVAANNASGVIKFLTGGTSERVRIDASGNVGIGTTSPYLPLSVVGNAIVTGNITSPGSGASSEKFGANASANAANALAVGNGAVATAAQAIAIGVGSNANGQFSASFGYASLVNGFTNSTALGVGASVTANNQIVLGRSIETVYIPGSAGIGTTSPASLLSVHGTGYISSSLFVGGAVTATSTLNVTGLTTLGNASTTQIGSTGSAYFASASGNVGIGTTSPALNGGATNLTVGNASAAGFINIDADATSQSQLRFYKNSALKWAVYVPSSSTDLRFFDTGDRLTLQAGGNVGIGTTTPSSALQVVGQVRVGQGDPYVYTNAVNTTGLLFDNAASQQGVEFLASTAGSGYGARIHTSDLGTGETPLSIDVRRNSGTFTNAITVLNQGNVGIGTTTPGFKLEVGDTATNNLSIGVTNISAAATSYAELIARNSGYGSTQASGIRVMAMGTGWTTSGGFVQDSGVVDADTGLSGGLSIMARASAPIRFYTAGSADANERMRIDSSGNVGIGTTTPGALLAVQGNGLFAGTLTANNITATGTMSFGTTTLTNLAVTNTSTSTFAGGLTVGTSQFVVQQATGNVGVGTANPEAKFNVVGGEAWIFNNGNDPRLIIGDTSTGGDYGAINWNSAGNYMRFYSGAAANALVINSSGNVGIGMTPTYKLDVTSADAIVQRLTGSNTYAEQQLVNGAVTMFVQAASSGGHFGSRSAHDLLLDTSAITKVWIKDTTGFVGVASSSPWGLLSVNPNGITGPAFVVGSSTATNFIVTNGGNVGIGTASPNTKLEVSGTGGEMIRANFGGNTAGIGIESLGANNGAGLYFGGTLQASLYDTGLALGTYAGTENPPTGGLITSGNVGIGTTTPAEKLDIGGGLSFSVNTAFVTNNNIATIRKQSDQGLVLKGSTGTSNDLVLASATGQLLFANPTGTSNSILNPITGNVGIGTTSPGTYASNDAELEIASGGDHTLLAISSNAGVTQNLAFTSAGVPDWMFSSRGTFEAGNRLSIYNQNAATAVMSFLQSGNVGIGTTSPTQALTVVGTILNDSTGVPSLRFSRSSTVKTYFGVTDGASLLTGAAAGDTILRAEQALWVGTNGDSPRLVINTSGNVGIGTTTPGQKLSVAGDILGNNLIGSYFTATSSTATSTFAGFIDVNGTGTNATSTFASNLWVKGTLRTGTGSMYMNDTGLTSSDGNLVLSRNGVSYLNGGNVGIGTTSPASLLSVHGTSYVSGTSFFGGAITATSTLTLSALGTPAGSLLSVNASGQLISTSTVSVANLALAKGNFLVGNDAGVAQATSSIFISSTGNVGIGTTTPAATSKLHIQGTGPVVSLDASDSAWIAFNKSSVGKAYIGITANGEIFSSATADSLNLRGENAVHLGVGNTIALTANTSNNIGIGTTSPWGKLSVTNTGTGPSFVVEDATSPDTSPFLIDASGNVGIGTTTVGQKFVVNDAAAGGVATARITHTGAIAVPGPALQVSNGYAGGGGSYDVFGVYLNTYGTAVFRVMDSGGVTLSASLPAGTAGNYLCINASYQMTYGASCTPSSERFKNDIADLGYGLDDIAKLRAVTFSYKPEMNMGTSTRIGFIAEEMLNVIPEVVNLDKDGKPESIIYEVLTSLLARGVQQLDRRTRFIENGATSTVLTVDVAGNVGVGTTTPNHKLEVAGDIGALGFVNTSTRSAKKDIAYDTASTSADRLNQLTNLKVATYRYAIEDEQSPLRLGVIAEDAEQVAPEILSANGKGVDLYKLATFTLAGVQALASKVDAHETRIASLEERVAMLESGAVSSASGSPVTFSTTSLASAFNSLGALIQKGIAQFNTLVFRELVASKDADGTSSAASVTIFAGNTIAQINNPLVLPSTKVFVTFNSPVNGSWYVTEKQTGSFRIVLSQVQSVDVSFDYFLVQTEGQLATSTPQGIVGTDGVSSVTQSAGADVTAPVITLLGDNPLRIPIGGVFAEPGVTVDDNSPVITYVNGIQQDPVSAISTGSQATYIITYVATDAAGNFSTAMRSVMVGESAATSSAETQGTASSTTPVSADTTAPAVTLRGEAAMQITVGDAFADPGATALDGTDGDLTSAIVVSGAVDTATAGIYTLTYTATDAAGNAGTASRVVTVVAPAEAPADVPAESAATATSSTP